MKKNHIRSQLFTAALIGSLLAGAAIPAMAQTPTKSAQVQLYGSVLSGILWTNKTIRGRHGGLVEGASRVGLFGEEDLGSGNAAIFRLENGFMPSSGRQAQGGRLFGRQAYVGLRNDEYGTMTLGRQYDFVAEWLAMTSGPYRWNGYFAHPGDNDNFNYQFRVNNTVKYQTPVWDGLQLGAMYSFGGDSFAAEHQNAVSVGLKYENGPVKLQAAYLHMSHPASAVSEGNWNTTFFAEISPTSQLNAGAVNPDSMKIYGLGGTWKIIDDLTLGAVWSHSQYTHLNAPTEGLITADAKFDNLEVNAAYNLSPRLVLASGYTWTRGKVNQTGYTPQFHQVNLMLNRFLSPRTAVFMAGIYQRAAGDAHHANIQCAASSSCATSGTRNQVATMAGIYHRF